MSTPEEKIEVRCPKCDNRLRFATRFIGRNGLCPLCGANFRIDAPAPAGPVAPVEVKDEDKEAWKISTYFKVPPRKKE
jgi:hypothetical protein